MGRPKIKVPTLRNIELRAPYMHLGGLQTLEDVIRHYAASGENVGMSGVLDTRPFQVTDSQVADIVAFLTTLTEEGDSVPAPVLPAN